MKIYGMTLLAVQDNLHLTTQNCQTLPTISILYTIHYKIYT